MRRHDLIAKRNSIEFTPGSKVKITSGRDKNETGIVVEVIDDYIELKSITGRAERGVNDRATYKLSQVQKI